MQGKQRAITYQSDDGFDVLRYAILQQAVDDYKAALKGRTIAGENPDTTIRGCEKFFASSWCSMLLGGKLDGGVILRELKRNAA